MERFFRPLAVKQPHAGGEAQPLRDYAGALEGWDLRREESLDAPPDLARRKIERLGPADPAGGMHNHQKARRRGQVRIHCRVWEAPDIVQIRDAAGKRETLSFRR